MVGMLVGRDHRSSVVIRRFYKRILWQTIMLAVALEVSPQAKIVTLVIEKESQPHGAALSGVVVDFGLSARPPEALINARLTREIHRRHIQPSKGSTVMGKGAVRQRGARYRRKPPVADRVMPGQRRRVRDLLDGWICLRCISRESRAF